MVSWSRYENFECYTSDVSVLFTSMRGLEEGVTPEYFNYDIVNRPSAKVRFVGFGVKLQGSDFPLCILLKASLEVDDACDDSKLDCVSFSKVSVGL